MVPSEFPRTMVGGVSLPRLVIGTNWFLGWSHTSVAKDNLINELQTRERIAAILGVFLESGIDAIMAPPSTYLEEAIVAAEQQAGRRMIRILTPSFNIIAGGPREDEPEAALDRCRALGATFCLPHQCVTDALVDRMHGVIRDMERYARLIRARGMIPGLSTHLPETVVIADKTGIDVEVYIQIYDAAGFLMSVEADWARRVIRGASRPVMTIKPLAAGRLLPIVGLSFVWNTIREQDMVTVGTATADEAREVIALSFDLLDKRSSDHDLQQTRSKQVLA